MSQAGDRPTDRPTLVFRHERTPVRSLARSSRRKRGEREIERERRGLFLSLWVRKRSRLQEEAKYLAGAPSTLFASHLVLFWRPQVPLVLLRPGLHFDRRRRQELTHCPQQHISDIKIYTTSPAVAPTLLPASQRVRIDIVHFHLESFAAGERRRRSDRWRILDPHPPTEEGPFRFFFFFFRKANTGLRTSLTPPRLIER